jgi:D-amino-acid dehydrogenase
MPQESNRQPQSKRVIVIGAGIVGLCTGLFLQRSGHSVTIVDPKQPGRSTSFGNAGTIAVGSVYPVSSPGTWKRVPGMLFDPAAALKLRWSYLPKMTPWLLRFLASGMTSKVEQISGELALLNRDAVSAHEVLLKAYDINDIVKPTGWLKVYSTKAAFDTGAAERAVQTRLGFKVEIMGEDEIRQLEPGLAHKFRHGSFHPENAFVTSPAKLSDAYAEAFMKLGGVVLTERVTRFEFDDARPVRAVTDLGMHGADIFVICAGAWSNRLTQMLGTDVPLDTERGYHLNLNVEAGPGLRRPTVIGEQGFVLAPMQDGMRLTSGVELAGVDAPPDFQRIYKMLPHAKAALPGLGDEVTREWIGYRPSMPDSKPVIGRSPKFNNVFFGFGHGHIGLTLSARTGQLIDDLVSGRDLNIDLSPFRAERF